MIQNFPLPTDYFKPLPKILDLKDFCAVKGEVVEARSISRLLLCFNFSLDRRIDDLFNEVSQVAIDARADYVEEIMSGYIKSITETSTLALGTVFIVGIKLIFLKNHGKKYRSTCTFAMYITKISRRLHKILQDFFVIYIAKAINSSDKMNIYFWYNDMRGTSPPACVKLLKVPQEHVHTTVK